MERIGNVREDEKKKFSAEDIFSMMWLSMQLIQDRSERKLVEEFVTTMHAQLIMAEKGWCPHGYSNTDDCPDCRH